jgi:hypothetical protein
MPGLGARLVGGGIKNAFVQVQGFTSTEFGSDWFTVLRLDELQHPCKTIHLDAIYHAIAEGLEVQLAWRALGGAELQPIMPVAGRGRIDFSDARGIQPFLENPLEEIVMRVLGQAKNPMPCIMLLIDLGLHQGAL